ncbi:piggyBac transposable element-derived protein 2-like [Portunus trituberculatus]|uniref:piggyBac transposable element-derived protein 2-like n=1 Tax=Portunus trituberculatus TaxID=210409 RepID=UPI001E1CC001|nr:piggyBac transposable element-derived protein 2-like [Portunus trituberculatus]
MAGRQRLDEKRILEVLEDLPSDYDTDTEVEEDEDGEFVDDPDQPRSICLTSEPYATADSESDAAQCKGGVATNQEHPDQEGLSTSTNGQELPTFSEEELPSTREDLAVRPIQEPMSRDRFCKILSNLHLNDNQKMDPKKKDKLYKLRPLVESLNKKFENIRSTGEHISVDESMIRFKGRSSLKQYNPMKPIKRGYKVWCLVDNAGYVFKFDIYTGKGENNDPNMRKEFGLGDKELKRGQFDYRSTPNGLTVYKWMDKKAVLMASNYHGIEATTVKRTEKDGKKAIVPCPQVVKDYNDNMGGVDKHDMLRQLYGTNRKSMKWWHRIFWGLLDMCIVNAYVVYKESHGSLPLLDFRRDLAQGLLTYSKERSSRGAPSVEKLTTVYLHLLGSATLAFTGQNS